VEEAEEVLVIIKTTRERFPDLQRRVTELHSYDIPELIAMPITEGLPGYLGWVGGEVMKDE
jgi:periplasmic divalent cation tolerance protein